MHRLVVFEYAGTDRTISQFKFGVLFCSVFAFQYIYIHMYTYNIYMCKKKLKEIITEFYLKKIPKRC